ncbi:hypothetical protein ABH924_001785 [Arthrobacter sp. GAS37]
MQRSRVARIEHGDIDHAQADTLRKYVEEVEVRHRVVIVLGNERASIA